MIWYKLGNQAWIKQLLEKAKRPDLIEKLLGEEKPKAGKLMPKWLEERRKK
jgi:hypothetical protein